MKTRWGATPSKTNTRDGPGRPGRAELHKARLYDASITDRLTGLKNNRHFQEQLERAMARCRREATDCGSPSSTSTTSRSSTRPGHKVGDFVLMQTAQILKSASVDRSDQVGYGGEEFCMLLTETELETAREQMDAFRLSVERAEHMWQDQKLSVTCSVGICHFPSGAKNTSDLFEFADNALYMAKQAVGTACAWRARRGCFVAQSVPAPVEPETEAEAAGPVSGVIPFELPAASTNNAAAWQSAEPVVGTDQGPGIAPRNPEEFSSTSLLLIDEDDPLAAMMG